MGGVLVVGVSQILNGLKGFNVNERARQEIPYFLRHHVGRCVGQVGRVENSFCQ